MARWSVAPRRSRSQWQVLVERHRASGLSALEFCRSEGVNVATYKWWERQLRASLKSVRSAPAAIGRPAFVPVTVRDGAMVSDAGALEVLIQGDERRVRIRADCPVALAVAVTEALRGIKSCS